MAGRDLIGQIRGQGTPFDPTDRADQFPMFRILLRQQARDHLAGGVVDQGHLKGDERVTENLPIPRCVADRGVAWQPTDGEPWIVLDEAVAKKDLRTLPVK